MQITIRYNGLARRWDWQTVQRNVAGGIYNTGPHPIGFAMGFLDFDKDVKVAYSKLGCCLTSGDSDDYAKIILTAPNKPVVDIEVNSVDAYAGDFVFKLCGSKGTYSSTNSDYKLKYIPDFSVYPQRPVQTKFIENERREPAYCSEKLEFCEESGNIEGTSFDSAVLDFYRMMYATVMEGKPLTVTPEMAAQVIRVIAQAHADNPLPVLFD
jgi:predicted dehydrogenase